MMNKIFIVTIFIVSLVACSNDNSVSTQDTTNQKKESPIEEKFHADSDYGENVTESFKDQAFRYFNDIEQSAYDIDANGYSEGSQITDEAIGTIMEWARELEQDPEAFNGEEALIINHLQEMISSLYTYDFDSNTAYVDAQRYLRERDQAKRLLDIE